MGLPARHLGWKGGLRPQEEAIGCSTTQLSFYWLLTLFEPVDRREFEKARLSHNVRAVFWPSTTARQRVKNARQSATVLYLADGKVEERKLRCEKRAATAFKELATLPRFHSLETSRALSSQLAFLKCIADREQN